MKISACLSMLLSYVTKPHKIISKRYIKNGLLLFKADKRIKDNMNGPTMIEPHLPVHTEMNMTKLNKDLQEKAEKRKQMDLAEIKRQLRMIELLEGIDRTLKEIKDDLRK